MNALLRRSLIAVAIFLPASAQDAGAFLARDRVHVTADIVTSTAAGSARVGCAASDPVDDHVTRIWRFAAGDGAPIAGPIRCASSTGTDAAATLQDFSATASLVLEVTTKANLESQMEGERVLVVKISWVVKRFTGLDDGGKPVHQSSTNERILVFSDDSDAFLPLVVADTVEGAALGFREVVIGFRVVAQSAESDLYGAIAITSEVKGAGILLDGGLAGTVPGSGQMILRNLPAGLREVGIRDPSGADVRRAVRVRPGRTVPVDLRPPGTPPGAAAIRLVPNGRNDQGYEEFQRSIDGGVAVRIPAGEFLMGNTETERTPHEHRVFVSEFLMDKTGVTWGQFRKFAAATGIPLPLHTPYWGILDDHPAVYVTWEEAKAYCEWAGGRLPTEAEREKAARGTDDRKYPWGDEEPTPERGVYRHTWGHEATGAVGTHPAGASPYGPLDLGGNVWEWCSDWYSDEYYLASPVMDPRGPGTGRVHVVRGGSWDSRPTVLSASCRNWGHRGYREGDFGFRCAMNSPGATNPAPE